ncbi:hypothetical protein J25TS5_03860 [Paenibacillus faecis]|nr:hypothetical protein J25TS5_03860 [Paenibacillus faecis]
MLGDLIASRGWTHEQYAKLSGRSPRMIDYFCKTERIMNPADIYTAMKIFGCEIEDLYEFYEQAAE